MNGKISAVSNAILGYVLALVNSAMALAIAFGVNLDSSKQAAIIGFVNALGILLIALNTSRRKQGTIDQQQALIEQSPPRRRSTDASGTGEE